MSKQKVEHDLASIVAHILSVESEVMCSCHYCLFLQMNDMRNDNVNPFLGFFHDCGVFAIVTEFCSRGSLEDLLLNEDVKLDWMFKSSLLLDLIKVDDE